MSEDPKRAPLLFSSSGLLTYSNDPQSLAQRLAQHYKLLEFEVVYDSTQAFIHRSFTAFAGDLAITCGYTSPIRGTMGERSDKGSITVARAGAIDYTFYGESYCVSHHAPLVFLPSADHSYASGPFNGVVFDVSISRLAETAAAMIGSRDIPIEFMAALARFRVFSMEDNRVNILFRKLCTALSLLDHSDSDNGQQLYYLRVDDLIYRLLACLILPVELLSPQISALPERIGRDQILEDLLEWLREHLGDSITLTMLEQRSGYSRRSLQKAFQARFGCGPIQWVRRQRLEQARLALLSPADSDNVSSIAARFGYSSLPVFSKEFRRAYGVPASALLHQGRRG